MFFKDPVFAGNSGTAFCKHGRKSSAKRTAGKSGLARFGKGQKDVNDLRGSSSLEIFHDDQSVSPQKL